MPTQEITIVYEILQDKDKESFTKLCEVAQSHAEFMKESVKQPIVSVENTPNGLTELIKEIVPVSRFVPKIIQL